MLWKEELTTASIPIDAWKRVRFTQKSSNGSTNCDIPGFCPIPEDDRFKERGDLLILDGIFERFWPCVHNVVNSMELILCIFDCERFFYDQSRES